MSIIKLKAKSFKKMEDPINLGNPVDKENEHIKYVCYVQANSIEENFLEWMETNPRQQNMQTGVAKKIVESLEENDRFHELNRGILVSADRVSYDNKEETVTIELNDISIHGDIDGGHTLRAILETKKRDKLQENRYVYFEIMTGIESPVELASARNTSNQVDEKSIQELERNFEIIKKSVSGMEFANKISYKMYEQDDSCTKKPIDVREVLAIITMFSQIMYPYKTKDGNLNIVQPVQCYTGKAATLKKFIDIGKEKREEMITNMQTIIPDIFELWDLVECEFNDYAKKINKRYTSRDYARYNKDKFVSTSLVSQRRMHYIVPKGLIYPIVGAFRALVQENEETHKYEWKKPPKEVLDKVGSKLVGIVLDEKADSPEYIGKNSNLWNNLFKEIYIEGHLI